VAAVSIIDQAQDTFLTAEGIFGTSGLERAQSFTVGIPGVFSGIDVRVMRGYSPAEFTLTIYDVLDGLPLAMGFASKTMPADIFPAADIDPVSGLPVTYIPSLYQWTTIDVTDLGIIVHPGDVLAFGFGAPSGQPGYFGIISGVTPAGEPGDAYPGGSAFVRDIDNTGGAGFSPTWIPVIDTGPPGTPVRKADLAFRTRVSTIPVPEAAWLFCSALGLAGWIRSH